jgi:hypothetical protein
MKSEPEPTKVSFPFYPSDLKALDQQIAALTKAGLSVRRGTIVRAVVCLPSATQMFAHALLLAEAQRTRGGVREEEYFADAITVRLPPAQLDKLDAVIEDLAEKGFSAKRAFIVRAVHRALPTGGELVDFMKRYATEFPDQPRGWTALKLKRAKHGGS